MFNKIKFSLFALGLLLTLCMSKNIQAATTNFNLSDLDSQGQMSQEYFEDNTYHIITVQKDINPKGQQLKSLSGKLNNTYTIQHSKAGYYSAKYRITVVNNKITSAHSARVVPSIGAISSIRISRGSSTQANLSFSQKILLSNLKRKVTTSIVHGEILVHAK